MKYLPAALIFLSGVPAFSAAKTEPQSIPSFAVTTLRAIHEVDEVVADYEAKRPANLSEAQRKERVVTALKTSVDRLQVAGIHQNELTRTMTQAYLRYGMEAATYLDTLSLETPGPQPENESNAIQLATTYTSAVPTMRSKMICSEIVSLIRDEVFAEAGSNRLRLTHEEREKAARVLREIDPFSVWHYGYFQEKKFGCRFQNLWNVLTSTVSADGIDPTLDLSADVSVVAVGFDTLVAMQEAQEAYFILSKVNDPVKVDSGTITSFWEMASLPMRMSRESFKIPTHFIPQVREYYAKRPAWNSALEALAAYVQASDLLLARTESIYDSAASGLSPAEGHRTIQKHLSDLPSELQTIETQARKLARALQDVVPKLSRKERQELARYAFARWTKDPTGASNIGLDLTDLLSRLQTSFRN